MTVHCDNMAVLEVVNWGYSKDGVMAHLLWVLFFIKAHWEVEILKKLRQVWDQIPQKRDAKMLWAASCLCFFGFLQSGEIGTPTCKDYDQAYHLCMDDVRVNSRSSRTFIQYFIQVRIKASKTRQGVIIYVGQTENNLCPVAAVLAYMVTRGQDSSPLF